MHSGKCDGQPTLVVESFGRAVVEFFCKGRPKIGHTMLADCWENLEVQYFTLQTMGKILLVLHLLRKKNAPRGRKQFMGNICFVGDSHAHG